jgi:hypothetical protein
MVNNKRTDSTERKYENTLTVNVSECSMYTMRLPSEYCTKFDMTITYAAMRIAYAAVRY